jgi:nitrogenase molybdenum-iron protein alpha/beta subunit
VFDDLTLDDLAIRASSHTAFFGIYLASHAIPDALCMAHASVGCKVKAQPHLVGHDGIKSSHRRMRYSQLIDEDLALGSTAQLEEEIAAWQARQEAGLVLVPCSTPVTLQEQPLAAALRRVEAKTGATVLLVPGRNQDADLYDGLARTMAALVDRLPWDGAAPRAGEVSVVGYPFDRYEQDNLGNVAELRRLLGRLGLAAKAVFFSGEPWSQLREAAHARHHVLLPYARGVGGVLEARGQRPIAAGLPMSITGTAAFLRAVGAGAGIATARVEAAVAQETARLKPLAELARRRLGGRPFGVFADAPRAAGIVATLAEVEMRPRFIAVLHRSPGGRAAVEAALRDHHGLTLDPGVAWLEDPTPAQARGVPAADCGLIVGTSVERDALLTTGVPYVELGFPSELRHFLFPAPYLGFSGVARFLEQAMHAVERPARPEQEDPLAEEP